MVFTLELSSAASSSLSFESVRSLRSMHDTIISSSAYCDGNLSILDCLDDIGEKSEIYRSFYATSREKIRGYKAGFTILQSRVFNSVDFVRHSWGYFSTQLTGVKTALLRFEP